MKELYIAPELQVICFAPVERLAGKIDNEDGDVDFGGLKDAGGSGYDPASKDEDYDLDLDL